MKGKNSMKEEDESTLSIRDCVQLESIVVESGGFQFVKRIRMQSNSFFYVLIRLA